MMLEQKHSLHGCTGSNISFLPSVAVLLMKHGASATVGTCCTHTAHLISSQHCMLEIMNILCLGRSVFLLADRQLALSDTGLDRGKLSPRFLGTLRSSVKKNSTPLARIRPSVETLLSAKMECSQWPLPCLSPP